VVEPEPEPFEAEFDTVETEIVENEADLFEPEPTPFAPPRPAPSPIPSLAAEAYEQAWAARPLSERLAAGSLALFGVWATWRIWTVL
jgi:hypothetical protein